MRAQGRWRVVLVICLLMGRPLAGRAEPAPSSPATSHREAMAEAERHVAAKDYRAAEKAYQAAVAANRNDVRAYGELAWVSLLAGDFDVAGSAAGIAAYDELEPRRRAMAFYNLGRAAEAVAQPVEAMSAYAASLALRDNAEVRQRLKSLAPGVLAPHRLAGPFARPEDGCKARCDVVREVGPHWGGGAGVAAPFRDAVKLVTDNPDSYPTVSIALQLGDDWYVLPAIGFAVGGHGGEHQASVHMVGARLIVDWSSVVGRFGHDADHALHVCGLGGNGRPSCVGPIVVEKRTFADHCAKDLDCTVPSTYGVWFRCRANVAGDVLEVSRDPSPIDVVDLVEPSRLTLPRKDACDALPIFGKHALTF